MPDARVKLRAMVEISEITDRESLESWLEEQPQQVAVAVAHRAAMRVLPVWWERVTGPEKPSTVDMVTFLILRANLISGVAGTCPTHRITDEIKTAARTTASAHLSTSGVGVAALHAVEAAAVTDGAGASGAAVHASVTALAANTRTLNTDADGAAALSTTTATAIATANFWNLIRADCDLPAHGKSLQTTPLWHKAQNPFADKWARAKARLSADASRIDETARAPTAIDWPFWIRWYEAALNGTPLNWKMLEEITLIAPDEWDKGPARVNALIGEIEARYALRHEIGGLEARLKEGSSRIRGVGDNQGPPLDDVPVAQELLIIWAPLQELKQEVEEENPSKARVLAIAGRLGQLAVTIAKWAAGKVDKFVNAFVIAAGTGTAGLALAWYTSEAGTLSEMLKRIAQLAEKWAAYLN